MADDYWLLLVNGLPSWYELPGTEPCRDATWSEVPETINLSSFPSGVTAVMTCLAVSTSHTKDPGVLGVGPERKQGMGRWLPYLSCIPAGFQT